MGKNQQYKQRQMSKVSSRGPSGGGDEDTGDGMVDASFHSPEWHAARLAALQTTHTLTWEEWKAQRKEELKKQTDAEMFEETRMKDYRAQLDKEREERLAKGRNHADKRDKLKKKKSKDKDKDKKSKKSKKDKGKRKKGEDSGSDGDSKAKKARTGDDDSLSSASEDEGKEGPVRLSSFFSSGGDDLPGSDDEDEKGRGKGKDRASTDLSKVMEEARRRAEIGAHMVAEVKKAEQFK